MDFAVGHSEDLFQVCLTLCHGPLLSMPPPLFKRGHAPRLAAPLGSVGLLSETALTEQLEVGEAGIMIIINITLLF